jgi:DNA-binding XRE family transcriptional regulator
LPGQKTDFACFPATHPRGNFGAKITYFSGNLIMYNLFTDGRITGAELQVFRNISGLTRAEFGGLVGVEARTVKFWENGRAGVPADVADRAQHLAGHARQLVEAYLDAETIALVLFKDQNDLAQAIPDESGMPFQCHNAAVYAACAVLDHVRVVWFDRTLYSAFLIEEATTPSDYPVLTRWALTTVPAQALAFKADQPPS